MQSFQIDTTVSKGVPVIPKLPLAEGQEVRVTIEAKDSTRPKKNFPLRGLKHQYLDPFEPAADADDWDVLSNGHS
jgi:hypothetical protein